MGFTKYRVVYVHQTVLLPITSVTDSGSRDCLRNVRNSLHTDVEDADFFAFSHFNSSKSNYIFSSTRKVMKVHILVFFIRHWSCCPLYVCYNSTFPFVFGFHHCLSVSEFILENKTRKVNYSKIKVII
jgi:hypothetical protein